MRVTYVQRFQGTGTLCKEEMVSGAVWSLTGPQILGRPTTYQGALPSSPRANSGRGWGALAAQQRFWSQVCTAGHGGDAGERGEGSIPQQEPGWSWQGQRTTRDREGGDRGEFLVPVPAPSLWWLR